MSAAICVRLAAGRRKAVTFVERATTHRRRSTRRKAAESFVDESVANSGANMPRGRNSTTQRSCGARRFRYGNVPCRSINRKLQRYQFWRIDIVKHCRSLYE